METWTVLLITIIVIVCIISSAKPVDEHTNSDKAIISKPADKSSATSTMGVSSDASDALDVSNASDVSSALSINTLTRGERVEAKRSMKVSLSQPLDPTIKQLLMDNPAYDAPLYY